MLHRTVTQVIYDPAPPPAAARPPPLRLYRNAEELLGELQAHSYFSEREREALREGERQLERSPAPALAYIILFTIQESMLRLEPGNPQLEGQLMEWESALKQMLSSHLPREQDVEAFLTQGAQAQELFLQQVRIREIFQENVARLHTSGNATLQGIRDSMNDGAAVYTEGAIAVDEITTEMEGVFESVETVLQGLTGLAQEAQEMGERLQEEHRYLGNVLDAGIGVLQGLHS